MRRLPHLKFNNEGHGVFVPICRPADGVPVKKDSAGVKTRQQLFYVGEEV